MRDEGEDLRQLVWERAKERENGEMSFALVLCSTCPASVTWSRLSLYRIQDPTAFKSYSVALTTSTDMRDAVDVLCDVIAANTGNYKDPAFHRNVYGKCGGNNTSRFQSDSSHCARLAGSVPKGRLGHCRMMME